MDQHGDLWQTSATVIAVGNETLRIVIGNGQLYAGFFQEAKEKALAMGIKRLIWERIVGGVTKTTIVEIDRGHR